MNNENTDRMKGRFFVYLISVVLGFIITFIFMLLFSVLGVTLGLSDSFATPLASVALAAGSLMSAFIASKKLKKGGLLNGVICGGVIFLISVAVALATHSDSLTLNTLFNFVITMLSALIGGVWGVNQPTKKII